MGKIVIPIKYDYDLDLTLYPSFTLAFFEKIGREWVKILGIFSGLKLTLRENVLKANIDDEEVVFNFSGLWYNPRDFISEVNRDYREAISKIIKVYGKLRLSINPYEKDKMFITIVLSQRTSFHVNVVKWVRKIFRSREPDFNIGRSYQIERAKEAYETCIEILGEDKNRVDPWTLRKLLLNCPNVGVKTVDAYLLFTRRNATFLAPADIHFRKFVQKFFQIRRKMPSKNYCMKYMCQTCPLKDKCITGWAMKNFGRLAGWLQTVAYVHDKNYCSKNRCETCPLRDVCKY
ncbi:MAG TPA: hypothetical protein ENF87_02120 [Thermoproteales archaeon]|nr:hypothetical protein [Thermoproteales archaeon]